MTDKEIKSLIESRWNDWKYVSSTEAKYKAEECKDILELIDSLQKEPVSESIDFEQELYKAFGQIKDFTLGIAIAKRFYDMGRKHNEPVNKDFEMALAEMIDKAQKCVVEPLVIAEQWKDELIKLAKSEEPASEPNKELAETYLAVFDKKFPVLPTLKGKQLADYKNFLNKCQQIFSLKEWGLYPIQAKLFKKLSLLWAVWGAEHLQGVGRQDEKEQDIHTSLPL